MSVRKSRQGLVDRFGRPITYLRIAIVDRCNLRCVYCMPEQGVEKLDQSEVLRLEEIVEVARVARDLGIEKVRITGGEPLIRRGVVKVIREIALLEGIETVALTTNGVRLAKYAEILREVGLSRVNVSLDSLDPDTFRHITRSGDLRTVMEGLSAARAVGLPVRINTVLFDGVNFSEVESFWRFARQWALEVRFIEQMGFESSKPFVSEARVIAALAEHHQLVELEQELPADHVRRFDCDGARIGFISPRSRPFCSGCNKLRLTPKGELRACLSSPVHVDVRAVLRRPHTEEEVRRAFRQAAHIKPEVGPWTDAARMWQIGG